MLKELGLLDRNGRRLLQIEELQEFGEFPERFRRRFSVFGIPDLQSQSVIEERVIDPMMQLAKPLGIDFLLSGRDIPLHTTILEGEYPQGDVDSMRLVFTQLQADSSMQNLGETLKVGNLSYKYVLMGASNGQSNLILAADAIPARIADARTALSRTYQAAGMKSLPIHILHMTLGRMSKVPESFSEGDRQTYLGNLINFRHSIAKNPIDVKIGEVYIGPAWDFITQDSKSR